MKIIKLSQGGGIVPQIENQEYYDLFQHDKSKITWTIKDRGSPFATPAGWFRSRTFEGRKFSIIFNGFMKIGVVTNEIPKYQVDVTLRTVDKQDETYGGSEITLGINSRMSVTLEGFEYVATWNTSEDSLVKNLSFSEIISSELGISTFDQIKLPHELAAKAKEDPSRPIFARITRKRGIVKGVMQSAAAINLKAVHDSVSDAFNVGAFDVFYYLEYLEGDKPTTNGKLASNVTSRMEAQSIIDRYIETAKNNGFVDSESSDYIPSGSNPSNWDFEKNMSLSDLKIEREQFKKIREDALKPTEEKLKMEELIGKSNKTMKTADDFSGFYSGPVPKYTPKGSMVDASQILSIFSRGSEAIELVRQISPQSLEGISSIFNFANKKAFGVYVPKLDLATKTEELKRELEAIGYQIEMTEKGLTAFPKEGIEKTNEEIQKDISRLYDQIKSRGGAPIGIDVQSNINAAKKDDEDMRRVEASSNFPPAPPDRWEWLAILHLASTIVHEAAHAHGAEQEGPAESAEGAFISKAINAINQKYKSSLESRNQGDLFRELIVTQQKRSAKRNGWYKSAQMSYYAPPSFFETPMGSDLQGRFPKGSIAKRPDTGMAEWSMMAQQDQSIPIEKRLGRQYMSPIPQDLDQANDIMEVQLRKFTRGYEKLDPHATTTELLSEGYDEDRGYTTLEGLLDEKRPKPLILPLKKAASKNVKVATLFGWMNNLSISDGNTIPGLGDRVMAWDDRDEDFAEEEKWIKQQPRYNPSSYDIKGFYQRWIEPRFKPELYDDMTRDYSNVHPAKRFATKLDTSASKVLSILSTAKNKICCGEVMATRFIVTQDIMPLIEKIFSSDNIKINVFYLADIDKDEELYSVWVSSEKVIEEDIERVEKYLQGKSEGEDGEITNIIESLFGMEKQKKRAVETIIGAVKSICKDYNIKGIYISGEYPRLLATKLPMSQIESLDFGGGWNDQIIRVGTILAEKLGSVDVKYFNKSSSVSFNYKDIDVTFNGTYAPQEIKGGLEDKGIDATPFNLDIYNKDFTVNMLTYDVFDSKIKDVTGLASKSLGNKVIETFFDPDYVCANNPMVILRAIKLHMKHGFVIDEVLKIAMKHHAQSLLNGYSDSKLILARENVLREGKIQGDKLLREFGLEELLNRS